MKVEITAEPDELAALIKVLMAHGATFTLTGTGVSGVWREVPTEVQEHLRLTAALEVRTSFTRFLEREVNDRGAVAELGTDNTKYVKIYVPGPRRVGAYAYVRPDRGYIDFRLPREAATGCTYAYARDVKPGHAYSVRLPLADPEALGEADRLAQLAAERALGA